MNLFEIVLRLPPLSTVNVKKKTCQAGKFELYLTRKVIKGAIHQNIKREQDCARKEALNVCSGCSRRTTIMRSDD